MPDRLSHRVWQNTSPTRRSRFWRQAMTKLPTHSRSTRWLALEHIFLHLTGPTRAHRRSIWMGNLDTRRLERPLVVEAPSTTVLGHEGLSQIMMHGQRLSEIVGGAMRGFYHISEGPNDTWPAAAKINMVTTVPSRWHLSVQAPKAAAIPCESPLSRPGI